jgi:hypothetical protein
MFFFDTLPYLQAQNGVFGYQALPKFLETRPFRKLEELSIILKKNFFQKDHKMTEINPKYPKVVETKIGYLVKWALLVLRC